MSCDQWMSLGGGADDPAVFAFACNGDRIIVTFNNADFVQLAQRVAHPGIVLIYQDNKPSDMAAVEIVKALANGSCRSSERNRERAHRLEPVSLVTMR